MATKTLPGGTCHLSMGGPVTAPLGDVSLLRVALGRRGQAAALLGTPMGTPLGLDVSTLGWQRVVITAIHPATLPVAGR